MNATFQGNNNSIIAVTGGEGTTNTLAYTVVNNDEPNVSFTRASSQFMSAPSTAYNINTGGGFTAVTRVRFMNTLVNERVFDFGPTGGAASDLITLTRGAGGTNFQAWIMNSTNFTATLAGGTIVQNQWTTLVMRYTLSTNTFQLYQDGTLVASQTSVPTINNRTLGLNYLGYNIANALYSSIDYAGLFIYTRSLSDSEITTCTQILTGAVSPGDAPSGAIFSLVARSLGLADGANVSSWGGFTQATSANQPLFWRRFNNWIGLGNSIFSTYPHDIAYARNRWVATGIGTNTLAYSDNGINWTGRGTGIFSTTGIGVIPMTNSENYLSFSRASSQWMSAPSTIFNIVNSGPSVALGPGSTNTLAYSTDGITWTGLGKTIFTTYGRRAAWSSSLNRWVAVGAGGNSIAYSNNGTTWTAVSGSTSIFVYNGGGVAWNGSLWVAVGYGNPYSVAYSSDGINWNTVNAFVFGSYGNDVAGNGSMWVGVGYSSFAGGNNLVYSYDGINWNGLGSSLFTTEAYGIAWSSSLNRWVAVGAGGNSIAYSSDGINWTGLGTSIFNDGRAVAWNGSRWVAVGGGSNSIAYSSDGIIWTPVPSSTSIVTVGYGVTWNGVRFIVAGFGLFTGNELAYSSDGITWTGSGTSMFGGQANGVGSASGTPGGITSVARVRFIGTPGSNERIFDFGNGQASDNILASRSSTSSLINFSLYNGATGYSIQGGNIIQNKWTTIVCRYNPSGNVFEIIQDGATVVSGTTGASISTRTLTNNYIARSNWVADAYANVDFTGIVVYDRPLSNAEITTCVNVVQGTADPSILPATPKYNAIIRSAGYSNAQSVPTWGNFSQATSANQPVYYNSFTFWLAGGEGTNSIAYSYDGSNWTGLGTSIFATCFENAWNARISKWISVGHNLPTATRSLAYSLDGLNWASANTINTTAITGLSGSTKWSRGVLAPNGKIYGIPASSTSVLILDPTNNTVDTTTLTGLTSDAFKWGGGVLAPNGKIYCCPFNATFVLIIDPVTNTLDTTSITGLTGTLKWDGAVLAPNGKIYCIPADSTIVLVIDPVTNTTSTISVTAGSLKWCGGVLASNGKIYGIPRNSSSVLVIDPLASPYPGTVSYISGAGAGTEKWFGGVLGTNGKIYGIPFNVTTVLIIDPVAGSIDITTITGLTGTSKWVEGVLAPNGKIYGIPYDSTTALIIDPLTNTTNTSTITGLSGATKWVGGVLTPNAKIYTIPSNATNVLIIDTIDSSFEQGYGVGSAIPYTNQVSTTAFPPTMSSNTSPSGYLASASTTYSASLNPAWQGFDNNASTFWSCADNSSGYTAYNTNTGVYLGNITTGVYNGSTTTAVKGEWLQIRLPNSIILSQFAITPRNDGSLYNQRSPEDFIVVGSNDGLNWTLLFSVTGQVYSNVNPITFNVSLNNTAFNTFRLIITKVGGGAVSTIRDSVQIAQWSLYPTPALLVAGGNTTNGNALAYSYDGCSWRGVTGTGIFSNYCFGVAWNGSLWVAVGLGTSHCIATSPDGISWTARGKPAGLNIGRRVNWTGTYWLVAGEPSANGNCLAISYDGINWTGITRQGLFTSRALSAGSNFSVAM